MASVDVDTTGGASGASYTVRWRVTSATGMPSEIFVLDYTTNTLQRVATPADMQYPTTRDAAAGFYRVADVTATYASLATANSAKATVSSALQSLVTAYNAGLATFLTTTSTSYT